MTRKLKYKYRLFFVIRASSFVIPLSSVIRHFSDRVCLAARLTRTISYLFLTAAEMIPNNPLPAKSATLGPPTKHRRLACAPSGFVAHCSLLLSTRDSISFEKLHRFFVLLRRRSS